jgi:hypothetical protein
MSDMNAEEMQLLHDQRKKLKAEYNKRYREKLKRKLEEEEEFLELNSNNNINEQDIELNSFLIPNIHDEDVFIPKDINDEPEPESDLESDGSGINENSLNDSADYDAEFFSSCHSAESNYLYPDCKKTIKDFTLSILVIKYKHKLSESAIDDRIRT